MMMETECHPFEPYIPDNAKILMLGTFPPKPDKWSMDFYYPNWINDMWRIMGLIFYGDANHFVIAGKKQFDIAKIKKFLNNAGIALYDTGVKIHRQKGNASDKYLDIIAHIDLYNILKSNMSISSVVTTGEKAASIISEITMSRLPKMGEKVDFQFENKIYSHFRMPSSSRAYPMTLTKKSEFYATMFKINDIHL